jgi:glycogen operon protein
MPFMASNKNIVFTVDAGTPAPQGATVGIGGVNFSIYSRHATGVELVLFRDRDDVKPAVIFLLDNKKNRTSYYWHIFVHDVKPGQLYCWKIKGPDDIKSGFRFDSEKFLLDPYSRAIVVPSNYNRKLFCRRGSVALPSMKSVVARLDTYDWEGDKRPQHSFSRTVLYEMHVAGFTKNPNSGVSEEKQGTYAGLIEKIPYLKDLGITAVELLPVFQFDVQDCPGNNLNYWGYSPISFFAPHIAYSSRQDPLEALDEFRDMVKAFHKEGIEVILDVVFNHTSEGNGDGPTYCYKGIDNTTYYILEKDKEFYSNYTGTGNTLNANHPIVRRMIVNSLHYWVQEMHVDGFRFDLASILARDENGQPGENPPVLWDIDCDPFLAGTKLIAEAWDAAGLYQVGSFIGDNWKEWNGRFRDDIRSFMKGDPGKLSAMVSRLMGSPDIYGHEEREPEQSINFVTCHDGFTLNDLVSYNQKHNEANGEENRDGSNDNLSWNCGIEGPSSDPAIETLRNRQVKNFHTINLLAIGAPMILMGDEVRRTQMGNNNAYCQDNELSWFDWSLLEKHPDILRFVKVLVNERLRRDASLDAYATSLNEMLRSAIIQWNGIKIGEPDWSYNSKSIAVMINSLSGALAIHYIFNAYHEDLEFELPQNAGNSNQWKLWVDTSLPSPLDICRMGEARDYNGKTYHVKAYSCVILLAHLHEKN